MKRARVGFRTDTSPDLSQKSVKLCGLCATLNHLDNRECWTCRWHGEFSRDEHTISLAWQRLEARYEQVRLEHVTSQKVRMLGDFGAPHSCSRWQTLRNAGRVWWHNFQAGRDLRLAQRQAGLRSRLSSRPDQLGV